MNQKNAAILKKIIYCCALLAAQGLNGYGLPPINLGGTNILAGGPLRPTPGFYWQEFLSFYTTDKFLDADGKLLGGVPSPRFDAWALSTQLVYFSDKRFLADAHWGVIAALPLILSAKVTPNSLGASSSGGGFGNLILGFFLQWDPIKINNRPFFVHRLEFDVSFPSGKNSEPVHNINPGTQFFYFNLSWAATLFFTRKWAASWRINYLWSNPNKVSKLKAGDAFYISYSTEYRMFPKTFVAINGYFLQQLKNNSRCEVEIPRSRERVFGIGPGFATLLPRDFILLGHFYVESMAINRTQGLRTIFRVIKQF
jgi:anthranilate 1,2-dioxygenase (deaminating, decarboxylating) large subunit